MTDQTNNPIDHELREAEALEGGLTRLFASLQPPYGAAQRLLAKLEGAFHESQLTLDDAGPYSFEQAAALMGTDQAEADKLIPDLLAAGLEEQPIDEDELDDEEE